MRIYSFFLYIIYFVNEIRKYITESAQYDRHKIALPVRRSRATYSFSGHEYAEYLNMLTAVISSLSYEIEITFNFSPTYLLLQGTCNIIMNEVLRL